MPQESYSTNKAKYLCAWLDLFAETAEAIIIKVTTISDYRKNKNLIQVGLPSKAMVDAVTTADSDGEYGNQICGDVSKL